MTTFRRIASVFTRRWVLVCISYAPLCGVLAVMMRDIRFDDPYITYRYAENLASGLGFRYNPGEVSLITTAPLYALLLALFALLGVQPATASFMLGVVGIFISALVMYRLMVAANGAAAAFVAGALMLVFPLPWLAMGFETPLFIAVTLVVFYLAKKRRYALAGLACGVALGLRGDGLIVLATVMLAPAVVNARMHNTDGRSLPRYLMASLIPAAKVLITALILYLPLAVWLTVQFGSPLPTTLQTKSAQAISGLTGFYPFTSYLQGAALLLQAFWELNPASALIFVSGLAGVVAVIRQPHNSYMLPIAWAVAHFLGYSLLGVAPYVWYYTPLTPAIVILATLGASAIVKSLVSAPRARTLLISGVGLVLVVVFVLNDVRIINVLHGDTPPSPAHLAAKLLPETKVEVYERVGRWINANTPPTATLGVTELGVMGYFAQRHTVDFLGLTQLEYLQAIRHGDYAQALFREQPDYLALSAVNAIYDFDPQQSDWFRAIYTPVAVFEDARFWGSPMTVWQRSTVPITTSVLLDDDVHEIGEGWSIVSLRASSREIEAGKPLLIRALLKAGAQSGTRTLRVQPVLLAGGDGLPVVSRLVHTDQWRTGQMDWVDVMVMPQQLPPKGGYTVELGWLEDGNTVAVGNLKVSYGHMPDMNASVIPLSAGIGIELITEPARACIGASMPFTLSWRGGDTQNINYTVFAQLRDGAAVIAQADGPPVHGHYPTSVWSEDELIIDPREIVIPLDVVTGEYPLIVGLYDPTSELRLPVTQSAYSTVDGGVAVMRVIVSDCR